VRTRTVNNNNTPEFNEEFCMLVSDVTTQVRGPVCGVCGCVCGGGHVDMWLHAALGTASCNQQGFDMPAATQPLPPPHPPLCCPTPIPALLPTPTAAAGGVEGR
jgi:hypothetical protein